MKPHVLRAVFLRNFVSYFANPTGYVFICLFVAVGAIAAFWVPSFFNNNLANLDQFSFWFPVIMLVYIPTITMGIWADERKQGTDELLLTIPARDIDIVLGKYLAAVGIFTVSLVFSLLCNYLILNNLASSSQMIAIRPELDLGLFVGTYIGYWLVGLAMLAIGAIASFLTSNITIAFVLGVVLNIPLVFLSSAEVVLGGAGRQAVQAVERWSIAQRFADFGHGVLTLSGFAYFAVIVVVMLYVSMVLIGRRHWFSGQRRWLLADHYMLRTVCLAVIALAAVVALGNHDLRLDVTNAKLSSLSPETRKLISDLKVERPVVVEAFVSPVVPENYVQTRANLLSVLRELKAIGGGKVQVEVHDTERYSDAAALADSRYGIEPRKVTMLNHGAISQDYIFLNVAVKCGRENTVAPVFIDRGIPAEYELARSIATVSQQKRKKLGVLTTDAPLYGRFNMQAMSASENWPIIEELEKQYDVVKIDPTKLITEKCDVLLAIQPSSLGPQEMDNFVAAVAAGQPTAIFEDPAPLLSGVPGTGDPRQAPGGMNPMFGGGQAPPKGDITKLWRLLGVNFSGDQIVWQDYNPYPKIPDFNRDKEFVFIDKGCGLKTPFDFGDPISEGLQQLLLPFPGSLSKLNAASDKLRFTRLVETGTKTGTVPHEELVERSPFGGGGGLNPARHFRPTDTPYTLAAHIEGPADVEKPQDDAAAKDAKKEAAKKPAGPDLNVVLVADVDMISPAFFALRAQGDMPEVDVHFDFDNVTFVLNALDELAGDKRFIDIRKRRPQHHTLVRIEERTADDRREATKERDKFVKDFEDEQKRQEKTIEDKLAELKNRKNMDLQTMATELGMMQQDLQRQQTAKIKQLSDEKERKIHHIETELSRKVRNVQFEYKMWAVVLPPILPLCVAILVFLSRRRREREGVAKSRLR